MNLMLVHHHRAHFAMVTGSSLVGVVCEGSFWGVVVVVGKSTLKH